MKEINEAKAILEALNLPTAQQNERSALVLLALSNIKPTDRWSFATNECMAVVGNKTNAKYPGILRFIAEHYQKNYAENSRETIRQQTLHQFIQAGIVVQTREHPNLPTNSKDNHYCLTKEALHAIQSFGSPAWPQALADFLREKGSLQAKYARARKMKMTPLTLQDGHTLHFSPGKHNKVQIAVILEFAPRFAHGSHLLYVGDTSSKDLYRLDKALNELHIPFDQHGKLPDILLFDPVKNWLYLIEAVTSHGPVSPKRMLELEELLCNCPAEKIYVTAFPDFKTFKQHAGTIAWETEVWIAENPDHLIHFNGDRFMGRTKNKSPSRNHNRKGPSFSGRIVNGDSKR